MKKRLSCEVKFLLTGQEILRLLLPTVARFITLVPPLFPPTLSQIIQAHTLIFPLDLF